MQVKAPCKFKAGCKNYKAGLPCPFSHDKCKFGDQCTHKDTCKFFHEQASRPPRFDKPIGQTECRFGAGCRKLAEGKCFFKHSAAGGGGSIQAERPRVDNRAERLCKFGSQCNQLKQGTCPYKHQAGQAASSQPTGFSQPRQFSPFSQPIITSPPKHEVSVLDQFCQNYLNNNQCGQGCSKRHSLSVSSTINRIFSMEQASQIRKVMIVEPTLPEEQPLYVILSQDRVMFGQLTNLAKQAGHEHIRTDQLVMKRCLNSDIQLPGQTIREGWLVRVFSESQRDDLFVLQSNTALVVIVLNKGCIRRFPLDEPIRGVILMGNVLLTLSYSKRVIGYEYSFSDCGLKALGQIMAQPLDFVKKYHKSIQGQQFAAGTINRSTVCFINKQLKTYSVDLQMNISDLCFTEYGGQPTALVLSQNGTITAINLLTFKTLNVLKTNLPDNYKSTSVNLTVGHILLAIDGLGVLAYNCQNMSQIDGILALSPCEWQVECSSNGMVTVLSKDHSSQAALNIYKVNKF